MATRVHYDGYLAGGVGATLCEHYDSEESATRLASRREMRWLAPVLEDSPMFSDALPVTAGKSLEEVMRRCPESSYVYLWQNGAWRVRLVRLPGRAEFKPLAPLLR